MRKGRRALDLSREVRASVAELRKARMVGLALGTLLEREGKATTWLGDGPDALVEALGVLGSDTYPGDKFFPATALQVRLAMKQETHNHSSLVNLTATVRLVLLVSRCLLQVLVQCLGDDLARRGRASLVKSAVFIESTSAGGEPEADGTWVMQFAMRCLVEASRSVAKAAKEVAHTATTGNVYAHSMDPRLAAKLAESTKATVAQLVNLVCTAVGPATLTEVVVRHLRTSFRAAQGDLFVLCDEPTKSALERAQSLLVDEQERAARERGTTAPP